VESVVIGDGITAINSSSFHDFGNLERVDFRLPSILRTIGESAFDGCERLRTLTLPDSLEEIGFSAFTDSSLLKSFSFGSKLRVLSRSWFPNSISFISVSPTNPTFATDNHGILFSKDLHTLILYPPSIQDREYTVPSSVEVINDYAFMPNSYSEEVVIQLTSITFPSSLREIGEMALELCVNLVDLVFPDSLEIIGLAAFLTCRNLEEISFGSHLSQVAPFWSPAVKSFHVSPDNPFLASDSQGIIYSKDLTRLVLYPPSLANTDFEVPETVQIIGTAAFLLCDNLVNISMRSVASIEDGFYFFSGETQGPFGAFATCNSLKRVEFGPRLATIGSGAFIGAPNLNDITFPDALISIGESAFSGCRSLLSIDLPDSLTHLPKDCFSYSSLRYVRFPSGLRSIGSGCFLGTKLESINLPDSVTIIESEAFVTSSSGSILSIDGGITGISATAFGNYFGSSFDTLLIRGSTVSTALCATLQQFSPNAVLVTSGSGFTLNQPLCNGTLRVTGFADPTPFPTVPASLSPRATLSRSPLASNSPLPSSSPVPPSPSNSPLPPNQSNATKAGIIVGGVFGGIALVVISVGVTCFVMRLRRPDNGNHQIYSGMAA
jgi:hypothetical protein